MTNEVISDAVKIAISDEGPENFLPPVGTYPAPRETVMVGIASYDWNVDVECMGGLMQCMQWYAQPAIYKGMSAINLARNVIAHLFVEKTKYEHLVFVDTDIIFMPSDWHLLWEGPEDLVTAEYAKKILGLPPTKFGLGFTRIHRSVFEKIKDLRTEDGDERVLRFFRDGELYVDYFPTGATQDSTWLGEDQGFFRWAALTGVKPRVETRTRLGHVGKFIYGYPDQIPGYKLVDLTDGVQ
ncbi:MAG: hypothetical protein ACREQ5_02920 [Candidatus Dormibacteria bacterium]